MGMFRQQSSENINEEADRKLQKVIEAELEKGNITLSGRRAVWVHLRNMRVLASQ